MAYENTDDAASAALWMLGLGNPKTERLGLLYRGADGIDRTPTQGQGEQEHAKGAFAIPQGSLAALFHNHPEQGADRNAPRGGNRATFSPDDRQMAKHLGVPSYISAGDRVRRFDPDSGKTSDVLAQFPMDEYRRWMMAKLLQRAPDDPRGLYMLGGTER